LTLFTTIARRRREWGRPSSSFEFKMDLAQKVVSSREEVRVPPRKRKCPKGDETQSQSPTLKKK